jgi:adenine-specific DNA methylase
LKPYGLFAFTYHHNDLEAYAPIVVALCDAGLCVTAALPCPAEMGASLHISGTGSSVVDTILCARKVEHRDRLPDKPRGQKALEERLSDQARSLSESDLQVTDGDLRCMALGILTGWAVNSLLGRWEAEKPVEERAQTAHETLKRLYRETSAMDVIKAVQHAQEHDEDLVGQQVLF